MPTNPSTPKIRAPATPKPVGLIAVAGSGEAATLSTATALAHELRLPYVATQQPKATDIVLVCTAEHIEVRDIRSPRIGPIFVDFVSVAAALRRPGSALSRRQPLARAIGAHNYSIADATVGFGHDAWLLATLGYKVLGVERCPPVAALLRDGLRRALAHGEAESKIATRLSLISADARSALPGLHPKPDVVYIDPMFPPKRRKSAAVKKELRVLRRLAGDDNDAVELFEIGRLCATDRIVVKRPDDAPPLVPKPTVSYAGKLVRYDVYYTRT